MSFSLPLTTTDPSAIDVMVAAGDFLGHLFPPVIMLFSLIAVTVIVALASAPPGERSKVALRVLEMLIRVRRPPSA